MKIGRAARNVALVASAVAGAYSMAWASTSSGATLQPPATISAAASLSGGPLYPGDSVRLRVTLTNNTEHPARIDAGMIESRVSNLPRGCRSSWFRLAAGTGKAVVVTGNGGTARISGTLTFVNAATDQSACAGAAPALSLSVR